MIVWGSGGDVVQLGAAGTHDCGTCQAPREYRHLLNYRYAHIWYLFAWVTEKNYFTACAVCGRGRRHDSGSFERQLGRVPIPIHRRFGGLALLGVAAIVAVAALAGTRFSGHRDAQMLLSPHVGDVYTVDLQALVPDGFGRHAWGLMRVTAVDGDDVTLQVPSVGYSRLEGARRNLGRQASDAGYYSTDSLQYSTAQLQRFRDGGRITNVHRR
ncbi:hypothetical protein B1992_10825 [Pseudoxanthomonas broegbernensis]|uniref:Zinc-ribbon domain-containing protein n=1 Tax=Pseudoxanthomonas broegbernensis TaxID=83619 RepID=A0A7V8K6T0_9GAMM|nr:hypothetical protein [Pseudoxanthomonas broegbernensis]KAF1685687.1 hypothetical protein B1992_10825 [Pseudoxanthomonas broegbernensis]MBB6066030.1 hypothetical protein [Pseudoxanthomonas broegbernensis]